MAAEDLAVARALFERWTAGDPAPDLLAEDVVWDASHFPDGGVFHGPEGVARFQRRYLGAFADFYIEADEFIDAGQQGALVLHREGGTGRQSGMPLDVTAAMLVKARDGKIARWRGFVSREAALRELGLPPR